MTPIGKRHATNPAKWFGLPKVDQTVLVGPNEAPALTKWIQSQLRAELDVGGLDEAVKDDKAAGGQHETVRMRRRSIDSPRLGRDQRDDGERGESEQPVVGLVGPDQAQAGVDAEDRCEHCRRRPSRGSASAGPVRRSGSLVFVIASTIQSMASTSAPTISSGELRQAEPLGGAGIERDGQRDDDPRTRRCAAALRSGSVPSQRSPLASTTAIAAHDSPIMKSASPKVDSTPMTQSSSPEDGEARTDDQREADPRSACAPSRAPAGVGASRPQGLVLAAG